MCGIAGYASALRDKVTEPAVRAMVRALVRRGPDSEGLEKFIRQRCQLRVELEIRNFACPLYGYPNPNMILCWQGKVVSNTVPLPN